MKNFKKIEILDENSEQAFIYAKKPKDTGVRILFSEKYFFLGKVKNGIKQENENITFFNDNSWLYHCSKTTVLHKQKDTISLFPRGIDGGIELVICSNKPLKLILSYKKQTKTIEYKCKAPEINCDFAFKNIPLNLKPNKLSSGLSHKTYSDNKFEFDYNGLFGDISLDEKIIGCPLCTQKRKIFFFNNNFFLSNFSLIIRGEKDYLGISFKKKSFKIQDDACDIQFINEYEQFVRDIQLKEYLNKKVG